MNTVTVDSLKKNLTFTGDLFIDSTFVLLPKSCDVTDGLISALKEWGFSSVLCDGGLSLGGQIEVSSLKAPQRLPDEGPKIGDTVRKIIDDAKNAANNELARIEMVRKVYSEYMDYIESIFTHYVTHKEIDQEELNETIKELCFFIKEHRRYILRVNSKPDTRNKNFLVIHSMRTTVLSIAIGQQLHLPLSKIVELGVTCLIHEIGMLQLPPQLYMKTKKLTPGERAHISKHTIFGYQMVKDLKFPLEVQLGVLEHHEKENGTGYPRKLTGDKIYPSAKIISVACSYEAISSPRSFRDERSTFDALIEMIQNEDNQYDNAVIKALLYTVSLYPIGTYVFLSNRKVAVVIDSNPDNPKEPIVQMLTEREKDGSPKIIQTRADDISILRILSKEEQKDILPMVEEKLKQNSHNMEVSEENTSKSEASLEPIDKPQNQEEEKSVPETEEKPKTNPDGTEDVDISFFS